MALRSSFIRTILVCSLFFMPAAFALDVDLSEAQRAFRLQQFDRAVSLFKQAADKGDSEAQYQLSNLYMLGLGVSVNESEALRWLSLAAAQRHPAAQFQLALRIAEQQPDKARALLEDAATQGYSPAQKQLEHRLVAPTSTSVLFERWIAAARKSRIDDLAAMAKLGQAIDQVDSDQRSALFHALLANQEPAVAWLLKQGANPNLKDQQGLTPLALAVANGNSALIEALIGKGALVSTLLPNGDSLLHFALRQYQESVVPVLVKFKVPINVVAADSRTALDIATSMNLTSAADELRAEGAQLSTQQINASGTVGQRLVQWRKLYTAEPLVGLASLVTSGDELLLAKLLPEFKAILNQDLTNGSNLLSLAVENGSVTEIQLLLEQGAKPKPRLIAEAARHGCVACITPLLNAGVDPFTESESQDAISSAITAKQSAVALALLESTKTNHKAVERYGYYLLRASEFGLWDLAIALLDKSNLRRDESGKDAFYYAAMQAYPKLIESMLALGWQSTAKDNLGRNAFYMAVEGGCLACAQRLYDAAQLNSVSRSGSTVLMAASRLAEEDVALWLLSLSPDVAIRNQNGETALMLAVRAGSAKIVDGLLRAGANTSVKNHNGLKAIDFVGDRNDLKKLLQSSSLF